MEDSIGKCDNHHMELEATVLETEKFLNESLDRVSNGTGEVVAFEFKGESYKTAMISTKLKDGDTELMVVGVWNEAEDPVACVDCFLNPRAGNATIDIKSHNVLMPQMPGLFGNLDQIYQGDKLGAKSGDSAFIVTAEERGTGLAALVQAETQYLLFKRGAITIEFAGDATVRLNGDKPTSFYGINAEVSLTTLAPIYEEGSPYIGPQTFVTAKPSNEQMQLLNDCFK